MRTIATLMSLTALAACGPGQSAEAVDAAATDRAAQDTATIRVTSPEFIEGATLALTQTYKGFGCVGSNLSPALEWEPVPEAKSYAVTLFDPDASGGGWWHWTVANIPVGITRLDSGAGSRRGVLPTGAVQGRTDFDSAGYGGPCPPVGETPHKYVFTVYALKAETVDVDHQTGGAAFKAAIEAQTIATGQIMGRFGR